MKKLILFLFIVLIGCSCPEPELKEYTVKVVFEYELAIDTIKVISTQPPYVGNSTGQLIDGTSGNYLTTRRISYFSILKREIIKQ